MNRKTPSDIWLFLLLAAGVFLWQRTSFPLWMVDLFHLQYAAYEYRIGEMEWMYTTDDRFDEWVAHREPVARMLGAEGDPNADYYPPFLPALLSPVAAVPARVWRDTVFALNVVLIFIFAGLIVRACDVRLTIRSLLWGVALVLLTYPMARATLLGQILPFLAVLVWIGLLAMRYGHQILAGILLGLVGAIKIFPAGFLVIAVAERRFRTAIVGLTAIVVIFGASLLTLGWPVHRFWWAALEDIGSLVYPFFGNQSPTGWFARAVMGYGLLDTHFPPSSLFSIIRVLGYLLFGGLTLLVLWRRRQDRSDSDFIPRAGLIICGFLLMLPVAWEHYWLFALPVLGWAIHRVWVDRDAWLWELWLAATAFFFTMKLTRFYSYPVFGGLISGSQTLGLLLLWIWLVHRQWNRSAVQPDAEHP